MSQSFTFIDVAGNQAQHTVSEKDHYNDFRWSTDHGDHGVAPSFEEVQGRARTVLEVSMAANRRSDDATRMGKYSFHVQDNGRSCKDGAGVTVRRAAVKAGHLYWRLEVAELRKDPLW